MKRTNFWTSGLEAMASGTVGPDAVTEQSSFQPKPGFKEGDEVTSEDKPKKTFGEDHDLTDNDDQDTVAESQAHTLALEHLTNTIARLSKYNNALEELAEQVEERAEANNPLTASDTLMLTTAIDAADVGTPMSETVAMESFDFSPQVATEAFADSLKERVSKVTDALGKFAERIQGAMAAHFSNFAASLKKYPASRIEKLKKNIDAVEGLSGRNFENTKREASIQKKIYAPNSSKNPLIALKDSLAAYDAATSFVDGTVTTAIAQLKRAYSVADYDKLPAALNKMLSAVNELSIKHSVNSKFTATVASINLKEVTAETANKINIDYVKRSVAKPSYDNSLKIASKADLAEFATVVDKASRTFGSKIVKSYENKKEHISNDRIFDNKQGAWSQVKFDMAYRSMIHIALRAISLVEIGLAEAVYRNAAATADWFDASIAEANQMRKA